MALVLLNEDVFKLPRDVLDYRCTVLLALGNDSKFYIIIDGKVNGWRGGWFCPCQDLGHTEPFPVLQVNHGVLCLISFHRLVLTKLKSSYLPLPRCNGLYSPAHQPFDLVLHPDANPHTLVLPDYSPLQV